jgi:hypothetical protein
MGIFIMKIYLNLMDDNGMNTIESEILLQEKSHFIHEFGLYEVGEFYFNELDIYVNCERLTNRYLDLIIEIKQKYIHSDFKFIDGVLQIFDYSRELFDHDLFVIGEELNIAIILKNPKYRGLYFEWINYELIQISY